MTKDEAVSLRDYIDTRIKAVEDRFASVERSTDIAANTVDKRLENMNEFRSQLNEQASHFITRTEHDVLEARIQAIERSVANIQGRFWAFTIGLTVMAIIVSTIIHFI
jgi:polyhydroxyalkanoate synthesis regulator phasin